MIKVETMRGKRYFVARNNLGHYISRRKYAGSKLNKESASKIFNQNNTFYKNRTKSITKLTNVKEISNLKLSSYENRDKPVKLSRPRGKTVMYQVSGYYKGTFIVANSSSSNENKARDMKNEAWSSFLERISQAQNQENYDENEGIKLIDKVKNIKEGWVVYR